MHFLGDLSTKLFSSWAGAEQTWQLDKGLLIDGHILKMFGLFYSSSWDGQSLIIYIKLFNSRK